MYLIRHIAHRRDMTMGGHGFTIELSPAFRDAVRDSRITQKDVDDRIKRSEERWCELAEMRFSGVIGTHVRWWEWGPEHITVPGSACGLDKGRGFGMLLRGGVVLEPHNVDSLRQKYMLLMVFTELADDVLLAAWSNRRSLGETR
jgi:hypothetical protein